MRTLSQGPSVSHSRAAQAAPSINSPSFPSRLPNLVMLGNLLRWSTAHLRRDLQTRVEPAFKHDRIGPLPIGA
eukprot:scaffold158991_cov36-Tisochrysis_lutea.AAC.2